MTTFKTLSARIRGAKTELEELGEAEEETLVTTSKLRDMVKGMTGFDIMEDEETFKSIYEILVGIGKEWDNLTDIERASLGEALAGKRNANVLYAVLGNTEDLEKAYETALNASGSALREQENYMRSLQYSLDVFKAELSELYSNVLESKSTKRIIDFATKLLDLIVKITDAIPPAIAVGSMFFASFAVGNRDLSAIINEVMDSVIVGIKGITDTIKTSGVKGAGAEMKKAGADFFKYFATGFSDAGLLKSFNESTFSEFKELFGEGGLAGKYGLTFGVETATDDFKVLEQQIGKTFSPETKSLVMSGVTSMEAYESSSRSAAAASTALAGATTLLKTALKGLAAIGITLAIGFAIKAIGDLVHREERLAEEADKARNSIEELDNTFKKMNETLDKSGKRFAELAQRVSDLGKTSQSQGGLSTDEYKEFLEISNELAEVFPGLQTDITAEGDALLSLNGTVKDITQSLEEYAKIQREIADHQMIEEAEKIFKEDKGIYKKMTETGDKSFGFYESADYGSIAYYERKLRSYELAMDSIRNGAVTEIAEQGISDSVSELEKARRDILSQTLSKDYYNRYLSGETLFFNLDEKQLKKIEYAYNQIVLEYKKDILLAQQEIDKANQDLQKYSLAYLRSENLLYQGMTGDEKLLVDEFVQSLTFEDINKEGIKSFDELKDWLQNGIISSIALIDNEETQNAMAKVLSDATLSALEKVDLIQEILDSLTESGYTEDNALVIFWKSQYAGAVEDYNNAANHILQGLEAGGPGSYYADQMRARQIAEELTADELAKVMNLSLKPGTIKSVEDLRELLQKTDEVAVTTFKDIGALLSTDVSVGPDFPEVTWGKVKDDLVGLAQAGKLDEDTLKSYKYYDDILNALGISSKEAEEQISDMIESINKMATQNAVDILANYKNEVDKLDDAYQKFKSNELIDANTLSALQDAFGDMDSFQEFQQAVMDGQTELQSYFDNMVTEYALENLALSEVTEETKEWTKQNLIAAGITEESAEKSINAVLANKEAIESNIRAQIEEYNEQVKLNDSTTELSVSTEDLNKLTAEEVSKLLNAANASGTAAQQIALFTLKKELASGKSLRNADDIEYLKELIIQAGVGIELINQLQQLKKVSDAQGGNKDEYEAFMKRNPNQQSWNPAQWAEYNAKYADVWGVVEFEKTYDQVWDEVDKKYKEMFNYTENVGLAYGGSIKDASKAGSDAAKEFKDTLDKILAMYDAELDAGVISFQTYVDKSRAIIEQYYRDGKIKAQDYYDELASLYEKQVQQYDKVISAVQKRLSSETEALEKQKETIEKSYNEQIEVIQKKIDALQDENDEMDKNLALNKAAYELARAQNQRTRLIYSESRGFYYEADLKGVAEAEENLRKAKLDKQVSEYQKQIKSLEEAMKSETDAIDEQIKKLNDYSKAWGEVSTKLEDAQNALRATEVLGPDWEANIMSGLDLLNSFTEQYVNAQQRQKDAYLAARTAEANNPVNANGGGTVNTSGGNNGNKGNKTVVSDSTTTEEKKGENNGDENKNNYTFEGANFKTPGEAYKARADYIKAQGDAAYNNYLNSHGYSSSAPYSAQKPLLDAAQKAREDAEKEASKKHIHSLFMGTESAKRGETLVGEIGPEIVLDKESGKATIVNSPALMDLKGGEMVFNAEETEKILKSKYKSLASVNPQKFKLLHAFANGTSSPVQSIIAAQAVGIANSLNNGLVPSTANAGKTVNVTFNVTMPNITDASKAQDLYREFEQLTRRATQYFK